MLRPSGRLPFVRRYTRSPKIVKSLSRAVMALLGSQTIPANSLPTVAPDTTKTDLVRQAEVVLRRGEPLLHRPAVPPDGGLAVLTHPPAKIDT